MLRPKYLRHFDTRAVATNGKLNKQRDSIVSELFVCVQPTFLQSGAMGTKTPKLHDLPDEIILHILRYVDWEDALSIGATCKRLNTVSKEPTLWREYCLTSYKYWAPWRNIQQRFAAPVASTDWAALFRQRRDIDRNVDTELNSILTSTVGRIPAITEIARFDYDAKDALLRHVNGKGDTQSRLARTYWAKAVLGRIRRKKAIQIWHELAHGEEVDSLTAMSAYDLFVLDHPAPSDPSDIETEIQRLVEDVRTTNTNWHELSTRSQALKLAQFLQHRDFLGVREGSEYHSLPHNFISLALSDPNHEALPLICAVIYSSIAQRLGLKAYPIGFPWHVYVVVQSPRGKTLDGKSAEMLELTEDDWKDRKPTPGVLYVVKGASGVVFKCYPESMFIDAFRSGNEVAAEFLKATLNRMGIASDHHARHLRPISTTDLLLRTGSNIVESCNFRSMRADWLSRNVLTEEPDTDLAYYSAVWMSTLLSNPSQGSDLNFRLVTNNTLVKLCDFLQYYTWDADLIEDYVIPLFSHTPQHEKLVEIVKTTRDEDLTRHQAKRRHAAIDVKVKYKIGQVFTHLRYRYEAVIIGWDTCCSMGEDWIQQMGVDGLSGGRKQSFYNVLSVHGHTYLAYSRLISVCCRTDDRSDRYVAEENIVIKKDEPSEALMKLAGRYFKRWEPELGRFVSNIREIYPDD